MGALLKFVIICFCIYLLLKWILKPVLQMMFKKVLQDFVKKQSGQQYYKEYRYEYGRSNGPKKNEGAINVDYVPPKGKEKRISDDEGEYVDYEEVK